MKAPYYEDAFVRLYFGDCIEVMADLTRNDADMVLTDPPYGVAWQSNRRDTKLSLIAGDEDDSMARAGIAASLKILRRGRHVYAFASPRQRGLFDGMAIGGQAELVWDKEIIGTGDLSSPWGSQHELILFGVYEPSAANRAKGYGNLSARIRRGSVLRVQRKQSGQVRRHPTEKPVELLRQIIESSSVFGEVVLDQFAGSGSTLVAATLEQRRAIGIESDEQYCETAARRLERVERRSQQ